MLQQMSFHHHTGGSGQLWFVDVGLDKPKPLLRDINHDVLFLNVAGRFRKLRAGEAA